MGTVKICAVSRILVGMDGNIFFFFFFHDLFPLCLYRQVGSDHRAGSDPFTTGGVPASKGVTGPERPTHGTDRLASLHRNGGKNALAAVMVFKGDGIGLGRGFFLRLRLRGNHLLGVAVQDDRQLRPVGSAPGLQFGAVSIDQAGAAGPLHGSDCPFADTKRILIGQDVGILAHADIIALQLGISVHHGHQLFPGDAAVGVGAVGHTGHHSPVLTRPVPGRAALGVDAVQTSQGGPDHGAADLAVGLEGVAAHALHQILLKDVGRLPCEPVISLYVGKGRSRRKSRRSHRKDHADYQQYGKKSFFHDISFFR